MQNLLQRSRRLIKTLQSAGGQPVDFGEVAEVLQDILRSDVLIVGNKGKSPGQGRRKLSANRSGSGYQQGSSRPGYFRTQCQGADISSTFSHSNLTVVPINCGGQRLGPC